MRLITLLLTLMLVAPALSEASFNEDKVISAIKVLMYQAPCCGSCPRIDANQARSILAYLEGKEDRIGKELWASAGDKILGELEKIDPSEAKRVRQAAQKLPR